jgi:hypothetical protein
VLSPSELNRLNDLLGRELGRNPFGEPLYSWAWADDLRHHMRQIDPVTQNLIFDYRCQCGLNKIVHEPTCNLTAPVPRWIERRMCPQLHQQYVAVLWQSCGSEDQWLREFGGRLRYEPRGYRLPTNACLGPGEEPDKHVTWDLIHKVRRDRKKSIKDWIDEYDEAMALKERRDESRLDAMISDAITAFGNAKPGARSGGISLPSKETSASGVEAGRE